jgi:hypothetical protein
MISRFALARASSSSSRFLTSSKYNSWYSFAWKVQSPNQNLKNYMQLVEHSTNSLFLNELVYDYITQIHNELYFLKS